MHVLAQEAETAARRLAELRGLSVDQVILEAVEAQARLAGATTARQVRRKPSFERMMEISERCAKRPVLDDRTADEIIGYDEFGVPK